MSSTTTRPGRDGGERSRPQTLQLARRALGLVVMLVFGTVGLAILATGFLYNGRGGPQYQCATSADVPQHGGPFYEGTEVTGDFTFFPVGVDCSYDVEGDGYGPQWVRHPAWLNTAVGYASELLALAGLIKVFAPRPMARLTARFITV